MPLTKQEEKCVSLACQYLAQHYGGNWSIRKDLTGLKLQEPAPEVIVGNDTRTAAVEVKRLIDSVDGDYVAYLRNNEHYLAPSCGGSYYLCPALGFTLPMSRSLRKLLRREINRVAPTLSPGQKGAIRIPRSGHVSLIASSGPSLITCLHSGSCSDLMSHIKERISGKFMLCDEGLEHSFITQECKDAFEEAVVAACNRSLEGKTDKFGWYEEWELARIDKGDIDGSHKSVWVLATSGARLMQASVASCVNDTLEKAIRKFRRTRPWADMHVVVLEASLMAPADLAAGAVEAFQPQDRGLISHFLIVEGNNVNEASDIVASLQREEEDERQRQQAHILRSPVSEVRLHRFKDDYLNGRREIGATEKIFKYFGAFQYETTPNRLASFGFDKLLPKGPFVEGSNWADLKGWEFAVSEERHLLKMLHTLLEYSISRTGKMLPDAIVPQPAEILAGAKKMRSLLGPSDGNLVVLATQLDVNTIVSLEKMLPTPSWALSDDLRTNWILGKYEDCPVLELNDTDSNSLYVVDVPRFASLVQYDPEVDLQVSAIDKATAKKMLVNNPELKLDADALATMVHLLLYQSYKIQVHDHDAVWAAKFASRL